MSDKPEFKSTGIIKQPKKFTASAVKTQSTESIIDDAKSIIRDQITRLKIISSQGMSLEDNEAKNLSVYIKSLMEMSREEREIEKSDGVKDMLEGLTNDELLELYKKQLAGKS